MAQQGLTKLANSEDDAAPRPSLAAIKIRVYRKASGLSAEALAKLLGVSQPAVLYWESGKKKAGHVMQGKLHQLGICEPNDWHLPPHANDASEGEGAE